jgi:hypothetical protein
MFRKTSLLLSVVVLSLLIAVPVFALPGQPDFGPHIYADGEAWGTKVTAVLPAPEGAEDNSFDVLYVFTDPIEGQLLVGEAGPGNPDYNGGRWETWTATWADDVPHEIPVLRSEEEILYHWGLGHLTIEKGSPEGGPPPYFSCPLLPVLMPTE